MGFTRDIANFAQRLFVDKTTGNVNIATPGARITADFSNATLANRVMFQTSTVNGSTQVSAIPNGTGTSSFIRGHNNSDPTNSSSVQMDINASEANIRSGITGTGTYLPLTFYTGGSERMRVDTSGNVLVISPAGLGYGTGSGGTVTQATSKSTSVTLNKPTGQITTAADALAANTETFFQLLNSSIAVGDVVVVNNNNSTNYATRVGISASGAITVLLKNISAASLSQSVTINFAIIKGATS